MQDRVLYCPVYGDKKYMLYSGRLIGNIRNEYDIKLATLAHGLCSVGQLGRIESGDRSAEKLLFDSLYQRLGKYSGRFTVLANCDEYEAWKRRVHIYSCIDDGEYETALKEIEEYRSSTDNGIHRQYLCLAECEVMHRTSQPLDECMEKLMAGIRYTYPDFDIDNIERYYLSRMEMLIAQQYVRYMELSGEKLKAVKLYHVILNCLEKDRYDRSERELLYRHVGYWLMSYYIDCGQCYEALQIGEKTYELTVNGSRIMFLAELTEGIILCSEQLGRDMTEERKKLAVLKRMNERYGLKTAGDFFPRYVEENIYNVNELIRQRRMMLGMTQEELAEGICDVTTISRLENNKHKLNDKLRVSLLQRLHLSGDKYISSVDTYEYSVFEKTNEIRDNLEGGKIYEAKKLLYEIENAYKADTINSRQYIYSMKNLYPTESNAFHEIEEALNWSICYDNCTEKIMLFENERMLIENLVYYYKKRYEYDKAIKYVSMLEPPEENLLACEFGIEYIKTKINEGEVLGEMGDVEPANRNLQEGIDMSVELDELTWLPSLTYIYVWNVLEKKEQKSTTDIDECREMLEYSYVLSDMYNNETRKNRIKKLCNRHGIWMPDYFFTESM